MVIHSSIVLLLAHHQFLIIEIAFDQSFLFAAIAAVILGISKAGLKGFGFVIVSLMALAYGSKASTGVLVPLLILADIFAVITYRKDVKWMTLAKLMPSMIVGVLVGVVVGDSISLATFKYFMSVIIIVGGLLMIMVTRLPENKIPNNLLFASIMGFGAGFTTMIGNLAGAFANLYFLALRFPKNEFIGTAAYMFFFINVFKLPFHIYVWKTIDLDTMMINLWLSPFVILGFFLGFQLVKLISNSFFQKYIIVMTLLSAALLLVS